MMDSDLLKYLEGFLTERRITVFQKVLEYRTRYMTIVLEDIYQPNNASAVLRSCDCFGIQDVHIIENRNEYKVDREVSMGSHKWLSLNRYNEGGRNTGIAIDKLRKEGYRIIATTPQPDATSIHDFNIEDGKFALFFGTELTGLSEEVLKEADEFLHIPMFGFTESFNISVSAAIILENLSSRLHATGLEWQLTDNEKNLLKLEWVRKSIKSIDLIEQGYLESRKPGI